MKTSLLLLVLSTCSHNGHGWSLNPLNWFKNSKKECTLDLNSNLNQVHPPVFLIRKDTKLSLALPYLIEDKGVFKLRRDESFYIACPGSKNEIKDVDDNLDIVESKCRKNQTLKINGKDVLSSNLECKNKITPSLKEMSQQCGGNMGKEIQLGYEIEDWHPLVTLCYNQARAETLYAVHTLYGSLIQGAESKKHQSYFIKGSRNIYTGVNPESAYKQANQRDVLTTLLGEANANRALTQSYLSRGHLAPDADFLLGTWQDATYFYINTAPQWQTVNAGNWLRLENTIRNFASNVKKNLTVVTGTFGVLELEDSNNNLKKLYLEPNKELMPVPLLFWKLVSDSSENSCMVFVVHNNPFLDRPPSFVCKNVCGSNGWASADISKLPKGFTYCCSYSDFKKIVPSLPQIECKELLKHRK